MRWPHGKVGVGQRIRARCRVHWARIRRNAERKTLRRENAEFPQQLCRKSGCQTTAMAAALAPASISARPPKRAGEKAVCQREASLPQNRASVPFGRPACANHKTDTHVFACGGAGLGCAGDGKGVRSAIPNGLRDRPSEGCCSDCSALGWRGKFAQKPAANAREPSLIWPILRAERELYRRRLPPLLAPAAD